MELLENVLLAPYTTFHIGGSAKYFVFAQTDGEVVEAVQYARDHKLSLFIFGGGSNVLVSDTGFDGLAVRIETIGIDIVEETPGHVILKVASGAIWDDVVRFAVEQGWWGIENLSHIPGFCGGFAVQNVGAYGQEAQDVVVAVGVLDRDDLQMKLLNTEQCNFGYRKSIFNTEAQHRYVILHTFLKLKKNGQPNLSYGDLAKRFSNNTPTISEIRDAVIAIRDVKFPFPDKPTTGNAGSFFRGPILSESEFGKLTQSIKDNFGEESHARLQAMQDRLHVPQGFKTPTAFLIELCEMKGCQVGGAKVNEPQPAIVLNASGTATAQDVLALFRQVARVVFQKTGVLLHIEPELIGFTDAEKAQILSVV